MCDLALTYNDQSVLENFHAALLCCSWRRSKLEWFGLCSVIHRLGQDCFRDPDTEGGTRHQQPADECCCINSVQKLQGVCTQRDNLEPRIMKSGSLASYVCSLPCCKDCNWFVLLSREFRSDGPEVRSRKAQHDWDPHCTLFLQVEPVNLQKFLACCAAFKFKSP